MSGIEYGPQAEGRLRGRCRRSRRKGVAAHELQGPASIAPFAHRARCGQSAAIARFRVSPASGRCCLIADVGDVGCGPTLEPRGADSTTAAAGRRSQCRLVAHLVHQRSIGRPSTEAFRRRLRSVPYPGMDSARVAPRRGSRPHRITIPMPPNPRISNAQAAGSGVLDRSENPVMVSRPT